jgi:oxazoline/thiazoline synthase
MELTTERSAGAFRAAGDWSAPSPVANARPYLKRQEAYGRGRTRDEAELGCIGEALERYSLVYRGDEPLVRARLGELDAIHPDEIQLFSDSQYAGRDAWNAAEDEIFWVGQRFDPAAPVDWIEARGLGREKRTRRAPAACCLMWYEFRPGEAEFARADTVGCGTGRTFDDAVAHALLEWIERDAMAIWWDNRVRRPAVRPESFESDDLDSVVDGLRAIGRELFLLDCTTDIGIPAYVAVVPREDGAEPLLGASASLSPRIAAYKAASEAGQIWYAAQRSGGFYPCLNRWLLEESIATQPYLAPSGYVDAPAEPVVPPAEALEHIVARLEACGLSAYAVDLSRSDVLWPAARAIVPGLRHIWNRRAPGRLYDVPVRMGWLASPVAEPDLNPIRCMI